MAAMGDYLRLMTRNRRERDPQGIPRRELAIAVSGGAIAGSTLFGIIIAVGNIGDFQALRLIEAALPTSRFLASTAIAVGATTIALILTLLSINLTTEIDFSDQHYRRIGYITKLSIVTIIVSTLVLIAVTVPIEEVEELVSYYDALYYVLAGATAIVGGSLIATALLISETVAGLVTVVRSDGDSPVP